MELQELISRGRFIFSNAEKRFEVFKLINGKLSAKQIAKKVGRSLSSVLQDIEKFRNLDLIIERKNNANEIIKKEGSTVYEKSPLIKHIPLNYFKEIADTKKIRKGIKKKTLRKIPNKIISIPNEKALLDICTEGEDQIYEFKTSGTAADKISKEVAGFVHTMKGGIIFYGIEDDGSIVGSDMTRQVADQKFQNSIRASFSNQPKIEIKSVKVMGSLIILIVVFPWDKKTIYQYLPSEKFYIRKGTNTFALRTDELKKLHKKEYVI